MSKLENSKTNAALGTLWLLVSACSGQVGGENLQPVGSASAAPGATSPYASVTSPGVPPPESAPGASVPAGTTGPGVEPEVPGVSGTAPIEMPGTTEMPSPSATSSSDPNPDPVIPALPQAINTTFTRLTRDEFQATVAAAFAMESDLALLPVDGRVELFTSNATTTDPIHPYVFVAEDLAATLVPSQFPACSADVAGCVSQNYGTVMERLFRRPASEAELARATSMIEDLLSQGVPAEEATRAMLGAVLLQPDFLFRARPNAGEPTRVQALTEHLSFALWDAPPDDELVMATAAGADLGLALRSQATRLTGDDQVIPVLARFFGQWLRVDVDLKRDEPGFEESPYFLELKALVKDALLNDVPVTELLAGTRGFVHTASQEDYGVTLASDVENVGAVTWPVTSARRGILAQELFQDALRHPDQSRRVIFRGRLVRTSLLCHEIPAPSAELVALSEEVGNRLEDPRCSTCHSLMDPIGGAFEALDEDFDGIQEPTQIIGQPELSGSYADLPSMLEAIAHSRVFAECFSKHFLGFFLEQQLNEIDPTLVSELADAVVAGGSLNEILDRAIEGWESRTRSAIPWCEGP